MPTSPLEHQSQNIVISQQLPIIINSSHQPLIQSTQQTALLQKLKSHLIQLTKTYSQNKQTKSQLTKRLKQLLEQKEFYANQKIIQERKYKSLNLLVNELQSGYEKVMVEMKSKEIQLAEDEDKKVTLQSHLLREQLIKLNELIKDDQKLHSFLKQLQLNTPNITSLIKKSDFIESQAETIAKLQTYINKLANPNFQCRRKWNTVEKEMQKGERHLKVYQLQVKRQVGFVKQLYEQYLERINCAKSKIVNFSQTKRDKLLTDYLIQQMSLTQQTRLQVEQQNKNLHYHKEQLQHEHQKVCLENSELESFFISDNRQEESRLAMKMKNRIYQLKDTLKEITVRNQLLEVVNKRETNLQYVREKLAKAKQANDFMLIKQEKINQGDFSQIDQHQIAQFFTAIINQTELKTQATKQRSVEVNNELKQLKMRELLLESQVGNLQEIVKENSVEKAYQRREIAYGNNISRFS